MQTAEILSVFFKKWKFLHFYFAKTVVKIL